MNALERKLKPRSRVSPAVGRLMFYFKLALQSRDPNDRAEMVDQWRSTVTEESQARGVLDIFRTGAWKAKPERVKDSKKPKPTAVLVVEKLPTGKAAEKRRPRRRLPRRRAPLRRLRSPEFDSSSKNGPHSRPVSF